MNELAATQVGVDLVARHAPGANAASHGVQLAVANQRADLVHGAAELGGELLHG